MILASSMRLFAKETITIKWGLKIQRKNVNVEKERSKNKCFLLSNF
jgi:hypothetical protein